MVMGLIAFILCFVREMIIKRDLERWRRAYPTTTKNTVFCHTTQVPKVKSMNLQTPFPKP
jgi:hypothetical protein